MIYQLNGKFGPFTLEAENVLQILAIQYKISTDHSVYVSDPIVIPSSYDHVQFNIEIQKHFPNGIGEYIDNNIDTLITITKDYIAGYHAERKEFKASIDEINLEDISNDDKFEIIAMLKTSYQNAFQKKEYLNLTQRMLQIIDLLEYRKKEIEIVNIVEPLEEPLEDDGN